MKATGKLITSVAVGSSKDVDIAVEAAKKVDFFYFRAIACHSTVDSFKGIQNFVGFELSRKRSRGVVE